jgi:hypothetical protein
MALDLSSLKKAVASLDKALKVAADDRLDDMPEDQQEVIKAGVIQNFEFTYELCSLTSHRRSVCDRKGPKSSIVRG